MKVGLSYSRCIRDIIDGTVDAGDVLVIIARTDFDPTNDAQWAGIWSGYHGHGMSNPEWADYDHTDEQKFRDLSIELWKAGKLHQPRQFGGYAMRLPYIWVETVLPSETLDENPALKAAWEKFQMLAALGNVQLESRH